ncbi:LysR family transcriptional regulator [uncultured Victivallis sp.]|uniref:LysR family transcriptional regulator n=1 Tax=uncultured Victivallis sp. TaxID=354118 RepID=UPI0025DECBDA|nr:LysR family transcriptional regulator [uncultured Victivallis sp.]
MELRVLRYFLGVARAGSMTGAARILHITQPTLSRQLQELEEELGQKLFIRNSHSLSLTPEGMLFRKRAEEILEMVHKTESEFSSMGKTVAGEICIGGGETEAMRPIARMIREIRTDYPKIRFHIFSGNAEDVMERLDKGILDFGILIQPVDIRKYNSLTLPGRAVWGVVLQKDSPLAEKQFVTRKDLREIPLICSRQVVKRLSEKNEYSEWFGEEPDAAWNIVATYNLVYNAALMVEEGVGCAIALDGLVNVTRHRGLCFRPLEPRVESGMDLVWKRDQVFSAAAQLFLEWTLRNLSAAGVGNHSDRA